MSNKLHWLEVVEYLFLVVTIVGLVVAIILGQVALAIAPLFLLVCLNLLNRRRTELQMRRNTSLAIAKLQRRIINKLEELADYYNDLQASPILTDGTTPDQVASFIRANVNPLYEDLADLQQQCISLNDALSSVVDYLNNASLGNRMDRLEQTFRRLSRGISSLSDQVDASMHRQLDDIKQQIKLVQRKAGKRTDPTGKLRPKVDYLESAIAQLSDDMTSLSSQIDLLQRRIQAITIPPTPRRDAVPTYTPPPPPPASVSLATAPPSPLIPEPAPVTWRRVHTLAAHSDWISDVAIAANGLLLISASFDQSIKIWDLQTGQFIRQVCERGGEIYAIALSPDGQLLAAGSGDQTIKLWNPYTGDLIYTFWEYSGSVRSVALSQSPQGQILASGNFDHTIKLWHLETRELIDTFTGHTGAVGAIAFSPVSSDYYQGELLASGSADGSIKIWDWQRRKLLQTYSENLGSVGAIAFSPDGLFLASGSGDKTVKLWHLPTGKKVATFKGYTASVTAVVFSPDGETLIGGSADGSIQIWHLATKKQVGILTADIAESVISIAISPDGQTMVNGCANGILKIWRRD